MYKHIIINLQVGTKYSISCILRCNIGMKIQRKDHNKFYGPVNLIVLYYAVTLYACTKWLNIYEKLKLGELKRCSVFLNLG